MFTTYARIFQVARLCVFLGFLPGLMACTAAKMACPPELSASAVEMPVTGRQGFGLSESFSFGPYKVTDVSPRLARDNGVGHSRLRQLEVGAALRV